MREIGLALGISFSLALALYLVSTPFLGPEAGQLVGGALASGPLFAEFVKRRKVRSAITNAPIDLYRESGLSWTATVTYGVLLMVAAVSVISLISAMVQHSIFASFGLSNSILIPFVSSGAAIPAIIIVYFQMGKLFALCRHNRWLALLAVAALGPLTLRAIDFVVIPQSYFDNAFPWAERSWLHFGKFLFWTTLFFSIPLTLGAIWYVRRQVRLRVSSMMRLLPRETQATIAELVHEELKRGVSPGATDGQKSATLVEKISFPHVRVPLLLFLLLALTGIGAR